MVLKKKVMKKVAKKPVKKVASKKATTVGQKAAKIVSALTKVAKPFKSAKSAKATKPAKGAKSHTKKYVPPVDAVNLYKQSWFLVLRFRKPGNFCLIRSEDVEVSSTDRRVGKKNSKTEQVDQAMLRVQKQLLDSPEFDEIAKHDSRTRSQVKRFTLKSGFDGTGISLVPRGLAKEAIEFLDRERADRNALIEAFIKAYPQRIEEAKARLQDFFDASRYDSVAAVRNKFKMSYGLRTIDMAHEIQSLGEAFAQDAQKEWVGEMQDLHVEIAGALRGGLKEAIDRLVYALTPTEDGKRRRLEDGNVESLLDFLALFERKNIIGDADCASLVEQAKGLIAGRPADYLTYSLRENEDFRDEMLKGFKKVADQVNDLVIEDESRAVLI
jgi:hypothetical protein